MTKPLVSVCCLTYNHENYIRECLDGFIMQKTDFLFEVLIHDDASTDKTADIIREYEVKYPNIIKPIYQTENQYSKGVKPTFEFNFPRAQGKYIAMCEGDDYWTDPYKLQKQVDFLEENVEYGLTHGDCDFFFQENKKWLRKANDTEKLSNHMVIDNKKELFRRLIDANYKIRTATVLFRKSLLEKRQADSVAFKMGDTPMWLDFSQMTKFKYFDEVFCVYRINPGSVTNPPKRSEKLMFSLSSWEMRIYYHKKLGYEIPDKVKIKYNERLFDCILFNPEYKILYPFFKDVHYNKLFNKNNRLILIVLKFQYFLRLITNKYF